MKAKIRNIVFIIGVLMMALIGCGNKSEEASVSDKASETANEEVTVTFEPYVSYGGGVLNITESDGADGTMVSEYSTMIYSGTEGETVGEMLEGFEVSSIEPVHEKDDFEGWMEFKEIITTDEDGNETYEYERLSGDTLYTFEEVSDRMIPDYNVVYVAKWAGIPMEDYFSEEAMAGCEESNSDIYLTFDSYQGYCDGILSVTKSDDTGGMITEEYGETGYIGEEGLTIGEILKAEGVESIEPVLEGDVFEGWIEYKVVVTRDENGFENWNYVRTGEEFYTMDEVLEKTMPGHSVLYVAKWAGISIENYF